MRINKHEWPLFAVCVLYAIAVLMSLLLTIYVVAMWRLALPSYDVVDHHAFLASAALGEMDWQGLWERHNGVHLIVLPKLVFWLDMYLVSGQGWLVTGVSIFAIVVTLVIVLKKILRIKSFSVVEKAAFCCLALLTFSSVFLAESLVNPIDVQWSLLALGSTLIASALDPEQSGHDSEQEIWSIGRIMYLLSGFIVTWLSAGPLSLMFLSVFLVWVLTSRDKRIAEILMSLRVLGAVVLLLGSMLAWEIFAMQFNKPLLLIQIAKHFMVLQDLPAADSFVRKIYGELLENIFVFMGCFVLPPLGHKWSVPLLVAFPFVVWGVSLWRSAHLWCVDQRFFAYLTVFSFFIGFAAGVMRFFAQYNYRHANMGFLLLLSSLLLMYSVTRWRRKSLMLSVVLFGYLVWFMPAAMDEAGAWGYEGRNIARYLQIGDALGVKDPAMFAPVWKDDAVNGTAVERSRILFREQGVGVYGSSGFRYYTGEKPLPAVEVACQHRLIYLARHATDPRAYAMRAETHTADGEYMTQALFLDGGKNVGWAAAEMPSDKLWQQWQEPWLWGGHMVFNGILPLAVQVVAFNESRRCQPWLVQLPARD